MLLQMAAEAGFGRRALSSEGRHYSAQELLAAAGGAAARIRESGCEFVSVLDVSSPATPVALFGAAMAGVPYAPLNYRLPADRVGELIARLEPLYLVADARGCAAHGSHPAVAAAVASGAFFDEAMAGDGAATAWPDDPGVAVQLFTSGTTGPPKAAILRHEHLMSYILGSVEFLSADEDEAALVSVPPYHIAGISALLSGVYAGRRIVQLANFDAAAWLDLAEREAVTGAFVVPTMLARIVETLEAGERQPGLGSLRAIAYGGGRMPVNVIERALERFPGVDFTNAYGLTETSSTIALLGPEDHRRALAAATPMSAPAWVPSARRCRRWRSRSAMPAAGRWRRECPAKCMCAAPRFPASIASAASSMRMAGFPPGIPAISMRTATCSCPGGRTT